MKRRGFTLIETMIAFMITGILVYVFFSISSKLLGTQVSNRGVTKLLLDAKQSLEAMIQTEETLIQNKYNEYKVYIEQNKPFKIDPKFFRDNNYKLIKGKDRPSGIFVDGLEVYGKQLNFNGGNIDLYYIKAAYNKPYYPIPKLTVSTTLNNPDNPDTVTLIGHADVKADELRHLLAINDFWYISKKGFMIPYVEAEYNANRDNYPMFPQDFIMIPVSGRNFTPSQIIKHETTGDADKKLNFNIVNYSPYSRFIVYAAQAASVDNKLGSIYPDMSKMYYYEKFPTIANTLLYNTQVSNITNEKYNNVLREYRNGMPYQARRNVNDLKLLTDSEVNPSKPVSGMLKEILLSDDTTDIPFKSKRILIPSSYGLLLQKFDLIRKNATIYIFGRNIESNFVKDNTSSNSTPVGDKGFQLVSFSKQIGPYGGVILQNLGSKTAELVEIIVYEGDVNSNDNQLIRQFIEEKYLQ